MCAAPFGVASVGFDLPRVACIGPGELAATCCTLIAIGVALIAIGVSRTLLGPLLAFLLLVLTFANAFVLLIQCLLHEG